MQIDDFDDGDVLGAQGKYQPHISQISDDDICRRVKQISATLPSPAFSPTIPGPKER